MEKLGEAALRELSEELGLQRTSEQLYPAQVVEQFWNNRNDKVHIYEVQLSGRTVAQYR